jgi:putative metalloenzyme radical SAM/SPASM domain maturase
MNEPGLHPSLRPYPSKLFVEVTTRCNLRCPVCVKESPGQHIAEGDLDPEAFARLAPALPRLDALVLNGIGEPLLHPLLTRFVAEARRGMPDSGWIGFQTNGQLLSEESARALSEAGVDRICISTDGAPREVASALRVGGEQGRIEAAAAALEAAGRRRGRPIALGVEFVAMRQNLRRLPDLVRWAARNHVSFVIVTHVLAYREGMTASAAFDPMSDRALELHREWRDRAAAERIDLRRALRAFVLKKGYGRMSPEDRRIVDFYLEMVARASEQDVCLKLERLMSGDDDGLLDSVQQVFAEAAEIARREGVELRLPAAAPRRERRCEFVEDGGAFVSWEGDVHPCYFLWHRYNCHVGGLAKRVQPVSFGNLGDADLLEIWNGAPARAFREAVLKYDYPFCYDCTFALCDYQQGPEFEQDCYASAVPCGACLWSTGVFQCLR